MISRDRELPLDIALINDCIKQFNLQADRLAELHDYYVGVHAITDRVRTAGLPNNMLVHSYPRYIATVTSGYLIGDPVQYAGDNLDDLLDAYDAADVQSIDAQVAENTAIFGVGVELVYANRNAEPRTTAIDPENAFVVYDDTADGLPIFGVYRLMGVNSNGESYTKRIYVYTDKEIQEYTVKGDFAASLSSSTPHPFGIVPLVEYWNNSSQTGDFEHIISLIDAYDVLESDRINDKEQFADALLVLTGVVGFDAPTGDTRTAAQRLKQEGTLSLPDVGAKAEYLIKSMNEADTDILRSAIKSDIHKFANVPDLSDENFAGNASGVAMKYKLFGLEQLTKIKERWFREGLRWRLRLFSNFLSVKGKAKVDADQVSMTFRRSLPVNDAEIAQMVATLQGIVPDNILLSQVPFIDDVQSAIETLDEQKEKNIQAQAAAFGAYPTATIDDGETVTSNAQDSTSVPEVAGANTLNGAQTQSLLAVVEQYTSKVLTEGQAINIIAISVGISKDEARRLLKGTMGE